MYCANCDGCNRQWEHPHEGWIAVPDMGNMEEDLDNSEWKENDIAPGTWYCPDCYVIDDNDVITFKTGDDETADNENM